MPDGNFSQAAAIAMNGPTIVGTWGNNITGPIHGIIWQGKKMMDFGPIARTSSSRLNDINENLEAVGWIGTSFNDASAVVYNHSSGEIFNLGPIPGGFTSEAHAVNSRGDVVGEGRLLDGDGNMIKHAFFSTGGSVIDIGGLSGFQYSAALAINDDGSIVGRSWHSQTDPNASLGFLWNGAILNLNELLIGGSNITAISAIAIDDNRIILAQGRVNLHLLGLLLSPVDDRLADFDNDGTVGPADLATLLASWGACKDCVADLDVDGNVDAADLAELLSQWG